MIRLNEYGILDQLANWLETEPAVRGTDPRNHAWADDAARAVRDILTATRLLVSQYEAVDNFTLGGALTNEPFMAIEEVLNQ